MNGQWKHHGRRENGGNTPTFALPRTRTPVLIKKKEKKKEGGVVQLFTLAVVAEPNLGVRPVFLLHSVHVGCFTAVVCGEMYH